MLGIQTQGRIMVGADDTTELWRPPPNKLLYFRGKLKEVKRQSDAAIAQWICLAYHPDAQGSNPKHTLYALILYSQICALFVIWARPTLRNTRDKVILKITSSRSCSVKAKQKQ